ncbi:MAG: right-handed parallel beta-helix repeat-containing protein [Planctomycetota bacterium]
MRYGHLLTLAVSLAPVSVAAQGHLWIVDEGPTSGHFSAIQPAIDAASEGDVVFVRPGHYGGFAIDGKSLTVFGEDPSLVRIVDTPSVEVRNLLAGQTATVRGLYIGFNGQAALTAQANLGAVWFEDLRVGDRYTGPDTLDVQASNAVVLARCEVQGGLRATDSFTSCYDSRFVGADGTPSAGSAFAVDGSAGALIEGGTALFSGCKLVGGRGGSDALSSGCNPGDGGPGLRLDGASPQVYRLETGINGGLAGFDLDCTLPAAPPIEVLAGDLSSLSVAARRLWASPATLELDGLRLVFEGKSGDSVFLTYSLGAAPAFLASLFGTLAPQYVGIVPPMGILTGELLTVELPVPDLAPGLAGLPIYAQSYFVVNPDKGILGTPAVITLLDPGDPLAAGADCDASGVADVWEIQTEVLADDDLDGVPNVCDAVVTLYVDDDAPGDPGPGDPSLSDPLEDGSAAHPFDAIQEAVSAATADPYTVVLVRDGTYTGAGNREIDFAGVDLTVRSESGPEACEIDCGQLGRGFHLQSGETERARIEGLTIRNGLVGSGPPRGGAIYLQDSTATLVDCRFFDNEVLSDVGDGGAVYVDEDPVVVVDCVFEGNRCDGGGGALSLLSGEIHRSVFRGNVNPGNSGAAVAQRFGPRGHLLVSACTFEGNSGAENGGALDLDEDAVVENCLIAGNSAGRGGGVNCRFGLAKVLIRGCTIVDNTSTIPEGAGVSASSLVDLTVEDSILWGNTGFGGALAQAYVAEEASFSYCDVQEGVFGLLGPGDIEWENNLSLDPLFAAPLAGDYALAPGSPCRDAARPGRSARIFEVDAEGGERLLGAAIDMGALED